MLREEAQTEAYILYFTKTKGKLHNSVCVFLAANPVRECDVSRVGWGLPIHSNTENHLNSTTLHSCHDNHFAFQVLTQQAPYLMGDPQRKGWILQMPSLLMSFILILMVIFHFFLVHVSLDGNPGTKLDCRSEKATVGQCLGSSLSIWSSVPEQGNDLTQITVLWPGSGRRVSFCRAQKMVAIQPRAISVGLLI